LQTCKGLPEWQERFGDLGSDLGSALQGTFKVVQGKVKEVPGKVREVPEKVERFRKELPEKVEHFRKEMPEKVEHVRKKYRKIEKRIKEEWSGFVTRDESVTGPPKPAAHFDTKDVERIEREGPRLKDLRYTHVLREGSETTDPVRRTWYPTEVLGSAGYLKEPDWGKLPQMPIMELLAGLRQRNWTHPDYRPNSPMWKLHIFQDNRRFLRASWSGYRALVVKEDGSQHAVDLYKPGPDAYLRDYTAGGTGGSNFRFKRVTHPIGYPSQLGYNQVFEQLFEMYEQKLPTWASSQYENEGWVDPNSLSNVSTCPAERHIQWSYNLVPMEFTFNGLGRNLGEGAALGAASLLLLGIIIYGIIMPEPRAEKTAMSAKELMDGKAFEMKSENLQGKVDVRFTDVAGIDYVASQLQEIVAFLKDPKRYGQMNVKPIKGLLLEGEPGNGKTLIAKAVAGEADVPFFQTQGAAFVEVYVGLGAARIRQLFKEARANAPAIIFIDEVDAVGSKRATAGGTGSEDREATLNQLLTEMDGFTPDTGVVVIAATNRSDLLDPALLRAGRFDRKVEVPMPNAEARAAILKVHARNKPLEPDVDLDVLGQTLANMSGAELANVLNEAALYSVVRKSDTISRIDIDRAVDRFTMGTEYDEIPDWLNAKQTMAIHEAGKALYATVQRARGGTLEAIDRVTMDNRGRLPSRTVFYRNPEDTYVFVTRSALLERIRYAVAGLVAQDIMLGEGHTTYGEWDLVEAQELVNRLVLNYGLSPFGISTFTFPPIPYHNIHIGRVSINPAVDETTELTYGREDWESGFNPSSQMKHKVLVANNEIMREAYADCRSTIQEHKAALVALTQQLRERTTLRGADVDQIVAANPPESTALVVS